VRQLQLQRDWPLSGGDEQAPGVYNALASGSSRTRALTRALELLEADPLLSAGAFRGDLLRLLMDMPASAWAEEPSLFLRYQAVVRRAAEARRAAPSPVREEFWRELPGRVYRG
jgi:hypothetical protein